MGNGTGDVGAEGIRYGDWLEAKLAHRRILRDLGGDRATENFTLLLELEEIWRVAENCGAVNAIVTDPALLHEYCELIETTERLHEQVWGSSNVS